MYIPSFRTKANGVPVLSKTELNAMGEKFVRDFQPEVLRNPAPVDVDGFVEYYLGMTPDFQFLSHNGIYLGMTVFNDTDRVTIYDPTTNTAEYISAAARTVIIDSRLLEEDQKHRYRFTMGHEASHDILHSAFFSYDPEQFTMFDSSYEPMIQCRIENVNAPKTDPRYWSDKERMEWQANYLSSCILMPESAVRMVAGGFKQGTGMQATLVRSQMVAKVSSTFDVSISAATIRLKELGYIPKDEEISTSYVGAILDFADLVEV